MTDRYPSQICEWCSREAATHRAILSMYELPRDAKTINADALFLCSSCRAKHGGPGKVWDPPVSYGSVADLSAALEVTAP